jgi:hypothetical protein
VKLATQLRNSPPGSDDHLIDELVGLEGAQVIPAWRQVCCSDPRYRAITDRGLAVVPALIAHLDDQRITRASRLVQGARNGENLRVCDVVLDILEQFNGEPFGDSEMNLHERVKVIGNWFSDAHKFGEEKYVVARVLGADKDSDRFRPTLFRLLAEKYPQHLPRVFRKLIDGRPLQYEFAGEYARAIAGAPIPADEKRKVLEYAAIQDDLWLRSAGVHYLRPFALKRAKELLLANLAEVSADPRETERRFVKTAAEGTDPEEWSAIALVVRRAGVGSRIDLLRSIARTDAPASRKHRLALLAEYLNDDDGPSDRRPHDTVRNAAALELARLLGLDAKPESFWEEAQWAEFRDQVRAKVAAELRSASDR